MSKPPFPGFPPSYSDVPKIGGRYRRCFIVEVHSLEPLTEAEEAVVVEQLGATVQRLHRNVQSIEDSELVTQDRFDGPLLRGLRLSK